MKCADAIKKCHAWHLTILVLHIMVLGSLWWIFSDNQWFLLLTCSTLEAAIRWSCVVTKELLETVWPPVLSDWDGCKEEHINVPGFGDALIWSGPKFSIGMTYGKPQYRKPLNSGERRALAILCFVKIQLFFDPKNVLGFQNISDFEGSPFRENTSNTALSLIALSNCASHMPFSCSRQLVNCRSGWLLWQCAKLSVQNPSHHQSWTNLDRGEQWVCK